MQLQPLGEEWPLEQSGSLLTGLDDASRLVELGMEQLHRLSGANDFTHGLLHLLSHGFERLIKYTLFAAAESSGEPLSESDMRAFGHDLAAATNNLIARVSAVPEYAGRAVVAEDLKFLTEDEDLRRIIELFAAFGNRDRYFDLDVLVDPSRFDADRDPSRIWSELEVDFLIRVQGGLESLAANPGGDHNTDVNKSIAAVLDRFHRAIARMWFLGAVGPSGAMNATGALSEINRLSDEQLGKPRILRNG